MVILREDRYRLTNLHIKQNIQENKSKYNRNNTLTHIHTNDKETER